MAKIPEINQPFWGFPYFFKVFPSHPSIFAHVFASPDVDGPKAGVPAEMPEERWSNRGAAVRFPELSMGGIPKMEGWFMMENANLKWI